jgi:hypothetical protein
MSQYMAPYKGQTVYTVVVVANNVLLHAVVCELFFVYKVLRCKGVFMVASKVL